MASNKAVIALVIVLLVAAVGYYGYSVYKGNEGGEQQAPGVQTETVVLPLGPGSRITINSTMYFEEGNLSSNLTIIINQEEEWPLLNVSIVGNQTQNSLMSYANLMIPADELGQETISLPLAIPIVGEGLCINLDLISSNETSYVYSANITIGPYNISVEHVYDSNGILYLAKYRLYSYLPDQNKTLDVLQVLKTVDVEPSNTSYKVEYNSTWLCSPPISSDLVFTWDAIIHLSQDKAEIVTLDTLRDAMDQGAYVAFLLKSCPHCQRTWPHLLEAINQTGTDVYAIVIGNLMDPDYQGFLQSTMQLNGITGYPTIAYFKNGFATDKLSGEAGTEEIVAFLTKPR